MNNKIGSSFLAAAALAGLMSGMSYADDTAGGASTTDKTAASSDAAPATSGKKAKKSAKGTSTCNASKSSCKSKIGCSAK